MLASHLCNRCIRTPTILLTALATSKQTALYSRPCSLVGSRSGRSRCGRRRYHCLPWRPSSAPFTACRTCGARRGGRNATRTLPGVARCVCGWRGVRTTRAATGVAIGSCRRRTVGLYRRPPVLLHGQGMSISADNQAADPSCVQYRPPDAWHVENAGPRLSSCETHSYSPAPRH